MSRKNANNHNSNNLVSHASGPPSTLHDYTNQVQCELGGHGSSERYPQSGHNGQNNIQALVVPNPSSPPTAFSADPHAMNFELLETQNIHLDRINNSNQFHDNIASAQFTYHLGPPQHTTPHTIIHNDNFATNNNNHTKSTQLYSTRQTNNRQRHSRQQHHHQTPLDRNISSNTNNNLLRANMDDIALRNSNLQQVGPNKFRDLKSQRINRIALPHERPGPPNSNIYILNIPIGWSEQNLSDFYAGFKLEVKSTHILVDQNGVSKKSGFVRFSNMAQASCAIQLTDGISVPGNHTPLTVRFAHLKSSNPNAHLATAVLQAHEQQAEINRRGKNNSKSATTSPVGHSTAIETVGPALAPAPPSHPMPFNTNNNPGHGITTGQPPSSHGNNNGPGFVATQLHHEQQPGFGLMSPSQFMSSPMEPVFPFPGNPMYCQHVDIDQDMCRADFDMNLALGHLNLAGPETNGNNNKLRNDNNGQDMYVAPLHQPPTPMTQHQNQIEQRPNNNNDNNGSFQSQQQPSMYFAVANNNGYNNSSFSEPWDTSPMVFSPNNPVVYSSPGELGNERVDPFRCLQPHPQQQQLRHPHQQQQPQQQQFSKQQPLHSAQQTFPRAPRVNTPSCSLGDFPHFTPANGMSKARPEQALTNAYPPQRVPFQHQQPQSSSSDSISPASDQTGPSTSEGSWTGGRGYTTLSPENRGYKQRQDQPQQHKPSPSPQQQQQQTGVKPQPNKRQDGTVSGPVSTPEHSTGSAPSQDATFNTSSDNDVSKNLVSPADFHEFTYLTLHDFCQMQEQLQQQQLIINSLLSQQQGNAELPTELFRIEHPAPVPTNIKVHCNCQSNTNNGSPSTENGSERCKNANCHYNPHHTQSHAQNRASRTRATSNDSRYPQGSKY